MKRMNLGRPIGPKTEKKNWEIKTTKNMKGKEKKIAKFIQLPAIGQTPSYPLQQSIPRKPQEKQSVYE